MPTKIVMPQLGESVIEGTVSRWLKNEGEPVEEMESLLEVETDKVNSEIPSPAGGTLLKILVPEGETVLAGTIIAWVGQPGEEIPGGSGAPEAGEVEKASGTAGQPEARAPEISEPGAKKTAEALTETFSRPAGNGQGRNAAETPPAPAAGRSRELGFISPIVARLAQEHQLDLSQVEGTGEGGRITKKDVLAFMAQQKEPGQPAGQAPEAAPWETPGEGDLFRPTEMVFRQGQPEPVRELRLTEAPRVEGEQPAPTAAPVPTGEGRLIPHSSMRRRIAEHMVQSKRTAPHVTTVMEADLHRVIAHYQANKEDFARNGARLTYTAYFVAAVVTALRAFPIVNSSWTDEGVYIHPQVNLGLAVSLGDEGLIVPVLKGADELSLLGLSRAISDLAARARGRKLTPDEVVGGTFTITNHGISGSLMATPVINQPQCGILGVGAIQKRVVVLEDAAGGDSLAIRPMVYLSLTFDHRILDGASADGFLSKVVEVLENWG